MDTVPFHIGIVTADLAASMKVIADGLGVSWTPPVTPPGIYHTVDGRPQPRPKSCVSREGPLHIDLIEGAPDTIWATDSPRLHHFAYWTADLAGDVARLGAEGWQLEMTVADDAGLPTTFAYLRRADGFRLELIDDVNRADYTSRLTD